MGADFRFSRGAQVCVTNSSGRRSQRTKNAADNIESAPETQERMELNYSVFTRLCCSWIPRISFVKTKLTMYNSTHSATYQKCRGGKHHGKLKIHQKLFLGANEYLLTLIERIIMGKWFKSWTEGKGSSVGARAPGHPWQRYCLRVKQMLIFILLSHSVWVKILVSYMYVRCIRNVCHNL
jgi:hypothetical protein